MKARPVAIAVVALAVSAGAGWWLVARRMPATAGTAPTSAPQPPPDDPIRRIHATLFYVADDGTRLTSVEREVPYAADTVEQARAILQAQLASADAPLVSAVPAGTTLRAVFLTPRGDAYVDLSAEVSGAHPGGSLNERLTIYTIVHALTMNLPAIHAVQILVDGREAETLAGHIDLRRPLAKDLQLTMAP